MKMKCLECGVEFDAARPTAKFHNALCRKKYSRRTNTVEDVVKTPVIKKTKDLPKLKPTKAKFDKGIIMKNPEFTGRMVWGGSVSHKTKRIYYKLPNGETESLPYTD